MVAVGIVGASGYTGAELLRLCAGHPGMEVAFATGDSQAGNEIAPLYPESGHRVRRSGFRCIRPKAPRGCRRWRLRCPSPRRIPGDHGRDPERVCGGG
ncbi:MAG: hypothetical protein M5U19_04805 [Microthrixaceae bacterium]|nr:hypothetical protein [Microthrixaceae bacterium]